MDTEEKEVITVGSLLGNDLDEAVLDFDLSEVQEVVSLLQSEDTPTIVEAERMQQKALRAADVLSEMLGKVHKTIHYLDAKCSSVKNRESLNYSPPDGVRVSIELRKMAGESSDELIALETSLSRAKGAKALLEKKYEIIIKSHHYYKDIANGLKLTVQGRYNSSNDANFGFGD
jgi:hypothetical protein